jgi:Domain of unknown function (DUF4265)
MEPELPHEHVVVAIEAGNDRTEELCVLVVAPDTYRLLTPPLFTLGIASGDEFRIDPDTRRPEIVRRSGNLVVWLYPGEAAPERTAEVADEVNALGGSFEGGPEGGKIFVFTIPVSATFPAVEEVFERFVADNPSAQWLYGNVYADDGVTPLGWWE